jgi:hypothetical protein
MFMDLAGSWRYRAEDNPDFSRPEYDDSAWESMLLPRNWFLGGLDRHGVVWFRTIFRRRDHPGKLARLRFDGVDYFADVFLNGQPLGRHSGYFEPFDFDVTKILRSGKNLLAVRVDSPYETPGLDGWYLRKKLIKGVLNHHDCRPGGGWDPGGQSFNTGGIWNLVSLEEHGPLTIESLRLRADLEAKPPVLHLDLSLRNRTRGRKRRIEVRCSPANFKGREYRLGASLDLPAGDSLHHLELPVPEARRWCPWDRGEPNLYSVSAVVEEAGAEAQFGFRTVRVEPGFKWFVNGEPYFPRGSNYLPSQWLSEMLFKEVAADKTHPFGGGPAGGFAADVALARQANLNLLRVHAHVLPPEFHAACDRAGMLVWQDFALQWGYSDEPDFQDEAVRQIRAMVGLLYNHPSIVVWCCHNESPCDAPWMAGQAGGLYSPAHNRELDLRLEAAVRELDGTRYLHRNSGTGDGHAYPGWYVGHVRDFENLPGAPFVTEYGAQGLPVKPNLLRTFAAYGPDGGYAELAKLKAWLDTSREIKGPMKLLMKYGLAAWNFTERTPAFKGLHKRVERWAMQNMMNVERSIYKRLPPAEELPPELRRAREIWEGWRFHDFQPAETFDNGIGLGASLDDFIDNSQAYQAALVQTGTEAYRRHKADPGRNQKESGITGIVQFDFTDPWAAVTWSALDYWRVPKPSFDALRRAMQPVLPTFRLPDKVESGRAVPSDFCAVNDTLAAYPHSRCEWRLENVNGYIASATFPVDVPANGVSASVHVTLPSLAAGRSQLIVTLSTPQGKVIGENLYEFRVERRPEALANVNPPVEHA